MDHGTWLSILALISSCSGCSRAGLGVDGAGEGPDRGLDYDPHSCRTLTLESEVTTVPVPGAVLLVFDRSGSMEAPWNDEPRWTTAGAAITNALRVQPDALSVGAIFFPSPNDIEGGSCTVNPIDAADQIDFAPSSEFLAAFEGDAEAGRRPKYAPLIGGMTPLGEALSIAKTALRDSASRGIATVVIVTDGEPTCGWDQERASQIVRTWDDAGIRTYVLGLPGRSGTKTILAELASTGGSGTFFTPEDAAAIERRFGDILVQTAAVGFDSCSVSLDPPARLPGDFHVVVTERGEQRELPPIDGEGEHTFGISADGSRVELVGKTCRAAMSGAYLSIRFDFDCAD